MSTPVPGDISKGKHSVFAFEMRFMPDPDGGQGAQAEEALSWGELRIWVQGKNLCEHFDQSLVLDAIHWYLLPILEWFAHNWEPLFHEEKYPVSGFEAGDDALSTYRGLCLSQPGYDDLELVREQEEDCYEWWHRHALHSYREGGLLPDIFIRRVRDQIEVSWGETDGHSIPDLFRFRAAPGSVCLEPEEVAVPLYAALCEAASYLRGQMPDSTRLLRLSQALEQIPTTDPDHRLAWMVGLEKPGSFQSRWQECKKQILSLSNKARELVTPDVHETGLILKGSCHAALMFGTVAPDITREDVFVLAQKMIEFSQHPADDDCTEHMGTEIGVDPRDPPWIQGYEMAEQFLEYLGVRTNDLERIDIDHIVASLGVRVETVNLSDDSIRAVALAGLKLRPCIAQNVNNYSNTYPSGIRFTLAHELCHLLFDRVHGRRVAIASGPWAPQAIEKRANAFAAMLLMPRSCLQNALSGMHRGRIEFENVLHISAVLGVGIRSVIDHLYNCGYLDPIGRQRLHIVADKNAEA